MQDTRTCLNCGVENEGHFCSNCGQKLVLSRISFYDVILEFLGTVFNLDSPFPKTIKQLILNPGGMINSFIKGQRKTYYSPIRYLILCLFISILFGELIGFDPIANQEAMDTRGQNELNNQGYQVGRFLSDYLNFFSLLFPICIAVVSRLFFWRLNYNLAERTVFGFFIVGQYVLLSLIPISLSLISPYLFLLNYILTIVYLTYGFYSFHDINIKFVRFIKSIFSAVVSIVVFYATSYFFAYLIMRSIGLI